MAVSAEDHYLRGHTERDACLVCRFRDAIAQLRCVPDVRLHRAHWIQRVAARKLLVDGHSHEVLLSTGLRVPVSRSHLCELQPVVGSDPR